LKRPLTASCAPARFPQQTATGWIAARRLLFNRVGYHGTNSNRICARGGYSTASLQHFKKQREIFLAAYESWVASEWKEVASVFSAGGSNRTSRAASSAYPSNFILAGAA